MQEDLNKLSARIEALEQKIILVERRNAVEDVHRHNVEVRLSSIEDYIKKLVWLIVSAILLALFAFMFQGGFNVAT